MARGTKRTEPDAGQGSEPPRDEDDNLPLRVPNVEIEYISDDEYAAIEEALRTTPIRKVDRAKMPFSVSAGAAATLTACGCPEHLIDNCRETQDLDALFEQFVNRPTDKQVAYLTAAGFSPEAVRTKRGATELIRRIKLEVPATDAQMREIARVFRRDGITAPFPHDISEAKASNILTQLNAQRPTTSTQRSILVQRGIPHERIPVLFSDAKKLLNETLGGNKRARLLTADKIVRDALRPPPQISVTNQIIPTN